MKAALLAAGKTVPKGASADDIELMHLELEAERETAETRVGAIPPVEPLAPPVETSEVSSAAKRETFNEALARLGTPEAGSKTPAVIEWAKANLSKEELHERYPNL